MYNKLFTKILDSSVWLEPAHVRLVWITMLAMQDQDGMVALSSIGNVAVRARVTTAEAADAIKRLESADDHNPGQEHEGRRIERVPGTGWIILNAAKYRAIVTAEEARRLNRERVQRHREKVRNVCNGSVMPGGPDVMPGGSKTGSGGGESKGVVPIGKMGGCNAPVMQSGAETETLTQSDLQSDGVGDGNGFGVSIPKTPPNEFDTTQATKLEVAVRKLPPRRTGILKTKPSTWPHHLKLLRVKDKISESDIARVMQWYCVRIGEEFVPEAFSGESFRKKFTALERAADRDKTAPVVITPQAVAIASRVTGLGWPKGSEKSIPGAAQVCLTAYLTWTTRRRTFMALLDSTKSIGIDDTTRRRLLLFGKRVGQQLAAPEHFVEQWLRDVHKRVHNWAAWSGDLNPYLFKSNAKYFVAMGRGWAQQFCATASRWDTYIEIMDKEIP